VRVRDSGVLGLRARRTLSEAVISIGALWTLRRQVHTISLATAASGDRPFVLLLLPLLLPLPLLFLLLMLCVGSSTSPG